MMEWWTNGLMVSRAACFMQISNTPTLHQSTPKLVEPEVVATSPYPIKSRVPVCCGFSSVKMVLAVPMHRDTGDAL